MSKITAEQFIGELAHAGLQLWEENGALRYSAPKGVLTPERREELISRKPQVLAYLRRRSAPERSHPPIYSDPEHRHDPFPITDLQSAYLIGRSGAFELGNTACHTYFEIDCLDLDLARFGESWRRLIERHDMLRGVFLLDGRQQILPQMPGYEISVLDLRNHAPLAKDRELSALREQMSHQMLSPYTWPLFDLRASCLDGHTTRLHLSMDLLIADAWSLLLLGHELALLYRQPSQPLAPLEISFRDYVMAAEERHRSCACQAALDFWLSRLDALPPAPALPLARNPASITAPRFQRRSTRLESALWERLKAQFIRRGLTPSGGLCAAFAAVLGTWSKHPDFTLNLTVFNRPPVHPDITAIMGDFSSTVLLDVHREPEDSFAAFAQRLQQRLWTALEHGTVSGVWVLRELSRSRRQQQRALMPVVFTSNLISGPQNRRDNPLTTWGTVVYGISQTPQVWIDHQVYEFSGALEYNWDVIEDLFPAGLLDDMYTAYRLLLHRLAEDERVWRGPARVDLPPVQHARHAAANATAAPFVPERLHTLFVRQVEWRRYEPAVITPDRTLTYDELYRRASQIGALLHSQGVQPNQLVAVAMDKGWEQVVAVLGILHSGGAYLPLDPHLPQERFHHLLQDADVRIALTQAAVAQRLNWPPTVRVIPIDELRPGPENAEPSWVPLQQPSDLAYVIYTSGSTGMPKGVMIDHQGAVNTILDMNRRFTVGAGDRVLALSALNFDLSVYDIFGLLAAGGAVVLPDPARLRDPAHWLDLIERHRVTLWNSVPAFMQMAMEYVRGTGGSLPSSVRLVLMSGDWIPVDLPARIRSQSTQVQIVSLGGATEASVWSILYPIERIDPGWPSIPYGKAMANQHCYVFNDFLEECPDWVPGQIGIGGLGVARGYWHDQEKTNKSFLIHPLTGERIYRTGDLGRYLPDGNIEFLGREDFQVKVGGYRIELGEVEAALLRHPQVREATVAALTGTAGQQRLIAYAVPQTRTGVTSEALRRFLQQYLPSYMIPVNYMFLEALPLTINGKVDRKALPEPGIAVSERVDLTPASGLQLPLLRMICEILGIEVAISIHDNLFDLGANSMHLIQLQTRVRTELGQELPTLALFEHTTVAALAAYLNRLPTEDPVIAQSQQRVEQRHSYRERQRAARAAIRASGSVSPASGYALSPSSPASSATSRSCGPSPVEREIDHDHA